MSFSENRIHSLENIQTDVTRLCVPANCELLCVYKDDFDEILRVAMAKKHESIKLAIRRFEYFKNFTDEKV